MKIYHGQVKTAVMSDSDHTAEAYAAEVSKEVKELGGSVDVGRNFGDDYAILMVMLPDDATVDPSALVKGVDFHQVHAQTVQMVDDMGIKDQG